MNLGAAVVYLSVEVVDSVVDAFFVPCGVLSGAPFVVIGNVWEPRSKTRSIISFMKNGSIFLSLSKERIEAVQTLYFGSKIQQLSEPCWQSRC